MGVIAGVAQPDLVRQIAEAIFHDQLLLNWRFYALVGGITFLAQVIWQISAPYLQRRSETAATKADMDEILRQIEQTTRVTEEVRSTVSQTEWVSREWRTTRRLKLEAILFTAYSLNQYADKVMDKWIYGKDVILSDNPSEQMQLLASLYYPELRKEVAEVRLAYLAIHSLTLDCGKVINGGGDAAGIDAARIKFQEGYKALYPTALDKVVDLEKKAAIQMATFAKAN